jgi:hypothetical protein
LVRSTGVTVFAPGGNERRSIVRHDGYFKHSL